MNPVSVHFQLQNIKCRDEGDGPGDAEPYLWIVFFKIDGETAFMGDNLMLNGTATVFTVAGDHGDLNNNDVNAGDIVPIPAAISDQRMVLYPIPLKSPLAGITFVPAICGCVTVLMEQDGTPDEAIA